MYDYISIVISYKKSKHENWTNIEIDPHVFFDIDSIDEGEIVDVDSISIHDHALDYLDIFDKGSIIYTKMCISNKKSISYREVLESYWDGQNSRLTEVKHFELNELVYHEYILLSLLDCKKSNYEIIRFTNEGDHNKITMHSLVTGDNTPEEKWTSINYPK